jgi:P27 family predicted phage terminase small subunit
MTGRPENSMEHIAWTGNARKLSATQLKERAARQEGNVIPLALAGGRPKCPKHLSKAARKEWLSAVKLLAARGVLDAGAGATLALYAVTMSRWLEAKADLDARGLQVDVTKATSKGELYTVTEINPMLKVATEAEAQLLSITKSLGIDPSAREKVKKLKDAVAKPGTVAAMFPQFFDGKTKR